ncbi:MAG: S8 family serine peptidase, partial [Lachnospiraceae bacterium]|nr:S8 family serine peptidase [Lachnospiraceae bacterium]
MESGKADNSLNLAITLPEAERQNSVALSTGYDAETNRWELIVKYNGDLEGLAGRLGFEAILLINYYAVITIAQDKIEELLLQPEIEFAEKPNRLFFELEDASSASCLPVRIAGNLGVSTLNGKGILVGIVDSGIDYAHPDFRNADGTTRIELYWDQTAGRIYTREEIDRALKANSVPERLSIVPAADISGHGTAVAGIAAGNGSASGGRYRGVAYESDLMVVKLGNSVGNSFPRTTNLMTAMDFLVREAAARRMPIAINLSFGNNYGAHDGTSLLEQYLNEVSNYGRNCIIAGTGNEGAARGHAAGNLRGGAQTEEFSVDAGERSLTLQLWKNFADEFLIELIAPNGEKESIREGSGSVRPGQVRQALLDATQVAIYYGEPKPYSVNQEIYFAFLPTAGTIAGGTWRLVLTPIRIVSGEYRLWLPGSGALARETGFLRGTPETTLTIPSTAAGVISVGAYDSGTGGYAYFSGRGYEVWRQQEKPDF